MITIPTGELVGLLSDAIPFADTDKDFNQLTAVYLRWDGEMLHAEATDRYSYGHAFWHPKDDPDTESDQQETLLEQWGSGDDPWAILLELADAKDIVKNFKLGPKEWGITLQVDYDFGRSRLKVARNRDAAHSALRQDVDGRTIGKDEDRFPDMEMMLARRAEPTLGRATDKVSFDPKRLAAFAKVRPRGPVEFRLWGAHGTADVRIGERFVGAITARKPESAEQPAEREPAESVEF